MNKVHSNFNQKLAVLLICLLVTLFSPAFQEAKAENNSRLELSATSGATGAPITIKGYNFPPNGTVRIAMYAKEPFLSGEMVFGYAVVRENGTFVWRGLLGRSSYYNRGRGEDPGVFTAPIGPVQIYAFPIHIAPSIDAGANATFRITDNRNGPQVSEALYGIGNSSAFYSLWERTDRPVIDGIVSRSWLWGPYTTGGAATAVLEPYKEATNSWRWVTYFDKARMEITKPDFSITSYDQRPYYITNGLLVREMVTGQLQTGDSTFVDRGPADIPTAGDLSNANKTPAFLRYLSLQDKNTNQDGALINQTLDNAGQVRNSDSLGRFNVTATNLVKETNHYIASPFWEYLNTVGPVFDPAGKVQTARIFDPLFYATGLPITEAYWTRTVVAGVEKDVLVQLFERRVLTYTPSNPEAYRVEMGNVGLQYFQWRYGNRN